MTKNLKTILEIWLRNSLLYLLCDKVHERDLHTDVLLGVLRHITRPRARSLKIIIMSASLNIEMFQKYTQYGPIKNGPIKNQGSDFEKKQRTSPENSGLKEQIYL